MSSVPDGRAANQPCSATTFTPPIGRAVAGRLGEHRRDRLARELVAVTCSGESCLSTLLLRSASIGESMRL